LYQAKHLHNAGIAVLNFYYLWHGKKNGLIPFSRVRHCGLDPQSHKKQMDNSEQ
jgi:hypothetical protein